MDKETYEALKGVMDHATNGGPNDKAFWDNVKLVEGWIDEVAKDYTPVAGKLQVYKDYTVDYRLHQFRRCKGGWENGGLIDFIDFKSDEGDKIICDMIADKVFDLNKYPL